MTADDSDLAPEDAYEAGYRRPPRETRFRPGASEIHGAPERRPQPGVGRRGGAQ
jgi:hypothetical protein